MKQFFKSDIARAYIVKFPNTSSSSLARKMYVENIELFRDVNEARGIIRYCRGLSGKKNRKEMGDKSMIVKPYSLGNPFKLPKSDAVKARVFTLPNEHNNILFISDLHIPYHDVQALSIAIQYGIEKKVNTIFINGDILDFFQISRFEKTARKRSVAGELDAARNVLECLNQNFPNVPIYFLKGNHDNRLEHYLASKAPELLDVEDFQLEVLLEARKHNMRVFEDTTLIKIGRLAVTHGHLLLKGVFSPVNPARGAFLRAKASIIISHVHRMSVHQEKNINGKIITTYSTGCLCELNPDYNPFGNNFSHGFAHIRVEPNGNYAVKNFQIIDGVLIN